MEMQQVRYFITLAKTLNFTRAAEECNVSQPSLTRAIRLLEAELGGELLRRERRQSHLTDLGQRMLPLMQQCYEAAAGGEEPRHGDEEEPDRPGVDRRLADDQHFVIHGAIERAVARLSRACSSRSSAAAETRSDAS